MVVVEPIAQANLLSDVQADVLENSPRLVIV